MTNKYAINYAINEKLMGSILSLAFNQFLFGDFLVLVRQMKKSKKKYPKTRLMTAEIPATSKQ